METQLSLLFDSSKSSSPEVKWWSSPQLVAVILLSVLCCH